MARQYDQEEELEREKYSQDHTSTNHLKAEIAALKKENEKLRDRVARLKARAENAEMLLEQLKSK